MIEVSTSARRSAALEGTKIGPLSRRLGLTARTLRYWEERGLLPPARRTPGGTRLYGDEHVRCARGVQHLKRAGLRLDEIVELQQALAGSGTALAGITSVREKLARREEGLRESIREQQALLTELDAAQRCAALCDGCHGKVYDAECIECLHHESGHALPDSLRAVMEAATRIPPKEGNHEEGASNGGQERLDPHERDPRREPGPGRERG